LDTQRRKHDKIYIGLAFLTLFSLACFCTAPFAGGTISDVSTTAGPTLTINPSSGPSGTTATITLKGGLPNAPVTLDLDPGSTNGTTDANGEWTYTFSFNGQAGDISNVVATIGNANEQSASATFEITGGLATSTPQPTPTAAPSGPMLTVSPSRGPSGTSATITLTGALPNAPVTLDLDPGSTNGTTDANGNWTYTHTFYGSVGQISNLKATIGNANEQSATATFEITGELEQVYNAISEILFDNGGHGEFIRMLLAFVLNVSPGSVVIEGPDPWVTVIGEVGDDGSFVATGRGTVAGFPGIAVVFEGTISMDHIAGEYTMGAEGGLPGGESITYLVIGEAEGSTSATVLAAGFFDLYNAAQGAGDSSRMFDMLHPAVLELYGEPACTDYLASIVNPEVAIEVLSAEEIGEWSWERDGRTLPIPDALSIQANIHNGGDVNQSELHLAMRPDGTLGWFTDCGEPQG
jgi:hypothetical protein